MADLVAASSGGAAGYGEAGRQASLAWQGGVPPLGRGRGGRCCSAYRNVCLEAAESAHRTVTLTTRTCSLGSGLSSSPTTIRFGLAKMLAENFGLPLASIWSWKMYVIVGVRRLVLIADHPRRSIEFFLSVSVTFSKPWCYIFHMTRTTIHCCENCQICYHHPVFFLIARSLCPLNGSSVALLVIIVTMKGSRYVEAGA